ncbi:uncharacterized protein [Amphiura filiformis]|uniref:uncharacterized protein n=1 Tax=Amphiura filiformis TaxID=82378 RepID=UPI003B223758
MAMLLLAVLFSSILSCVTQTPTQYTMHTPAISVLESVGTVEICMSRTGDDISQKGFAILTTQDDTAVAGQDFDALNRFSFEFEPNKKEKCLDFAIKNDDIGEFKEKFKITIVDASDGIPGSQMSTEITIAENDFCTAIPITGSTVPFYVSPWNPVDGKPIVFKNTLGITSTLTLFFSSTLDFVFNGNDIYDVYQFRIRHPVDVYQFEVNRVAGTYQEDLTVVPNAPTGDDSETISITFDQSNGKFTLRFSNAPDSPVIVQDTSTPITVRHIFAVVDDDVAGDFTLCNVDPINLPEIQEDQSSTSQTYPSAIASRATDNNRNSGFTGIPTCSVTDNFQDPWWRLDLGKEYDVSVVNIFPVADDDPSGFNADDIGGVQVFVGSCDETLIDQLNLCGQAPADIPTSDIMFPNTILAEGLTRIPTSISCTQANTYGRYVYIRLDTLNTATAVLPICEVDVYGTEVPFGSETTISFASPTYSAEEADGNVQVSVEIDGPGSTCAGVDVYTEDDTAIASGITPDQNDYTAISEVTPTRLTFDPTTTTHPINISINSDMECEEQEQFKVVLNNPENAILGSTLETEVSISDDDSTEYAFENANLVIAVQEQGAPIPITIVRTGPADALNDPGSVLFISEQENNAIRETVNFDPEETSKEVTIEAYDDNIFESDTMFNIRLETIGQCDALAVDDRMTTVTVTDDDSRFCFDDENLDDNELVIPESTDTYQIKIRRDGDLRDRTVDISVQSTNDEYNRAQEGIDFTISPKSLTFESGKDEAFITVTITNDYYKEDGETFALILSDPEGIPQNVKEPNRITVKITDDDDIYRFVPNYYSVSEGGGSVNVCLERVGALSQMTTINLSTRDVTAQIGRDYRVPSGGITVTFFAGLSEACTPITIVGDSVAESAETFVVQIVSEDIETEYNTQATVSIHDDPDVFISFASEFYRVREDEGKAVVYITKSGDIRQSVSATIRSASLTADENDYDSVSDAIRIPSGASTISYEVTIRDDADDESDEQFELILSDAIGGIISDEDTTVTIQDNDDQMPEITATGISGGALVGIIAAAVVITIVTALGIGLFCFYLIRRRPAQVVTAPPGQYQLSQYPGSYVGGPIKLPSNRESYLTGQPPPLIYNSYR